MGLPSRIALHARHRHGADCLDDRGQAAHVRSKEPGRGGAARSLILCLVLASAAADADTLRIATLNTELSRDGPGLLLHDIRRGRDADIAAAVAMITRARPDVIVLQGMDYDLGLVALGAFRDQIAVSGPNYPHVFALRPNTGIPTGIDLDSDGFADGPRDAQGFGAFSGQGGMAILSHWPVTLVLDHSDFLWRDLPGSLVTAGDPGADIQRLSSVAHWTLRIEPPRAPPVSLLTFHATPPVFDGPEDRNGRRNHDEVAFWLSYLEANPHPEGRFFLAGVANLDPVDGQGRPNALRQLLRHPMLQDPEPRSALGKEMAKEGGVNAAHRGDPALDTANWRDVDGPGNLRISYILPSADWAVVDSGLIWPEPSGSDGSPVTRHGLVWVDLRG